MSAKAYEAFVREHRALGFTDFATVVPPADRVGVLQAIATDIVPRLRLEFDPAVVA